MVTGLLKPGAHFDWRLLNLYFEILTLDQHDCRRREPQQLMETARISAIPWDHVDANGILATEALRLSKSEKVIEELFEKNDLSPNTYKFEWVI